jgi:hypothetical protein
MNKILTVRSFVKSRLERYVTSLNSDGGGEYVSKEYEEFTNAKGIEHQVTPMNTPQYNARSERMNKILCDPARAMLKEKEMPAKFWGEAIIYAAYIYNRTKASGSDKTKYEEFFDEKPSLQKIHTFGSPVTFANNDPHKKKLDDRGLKGIFVGVNNSGTYRVYDMRSGRVVSSRDVIFYAEEMPSFLAGDDNGVLAIEGDDEGVLVEDEDVSRLFSSSVIDLTGDEVAGLPEAPMDLPLVPVRPARSVSSSVPTRVQPKRGVRVDPSSDPLMDKIVPYDKEEALSISCSTQSTPLSFADVNGVRGEGKVVEINEKRSGEYPGEKGV